MPWTSATQYEGETLFAFNLGFDHLFKVLRL